MFCVFNSYKMVFVLYLVLHVSSQLQLKKTAINCNTFHKGKKKSKNNIEVFDRRQRA